MALPSPLLRQCMSNFPHVQVLFETVCKACNTDSARCWDNSQVCIVDTNPVVVLSIVDAVRVACAGLLMQEHFGPTGQR